MTHYEENVVKFVNTFTVSDWEGRRPNEKIRRGITRVSKSNSQSIDKLGIKLKPVRAEYMNNQNCNSANRQPPTVQNEEVILLLDRIKQLEGQLIVLQKEKIELQQLVQQEKENKRTKFTGQLIESHYVSCKQDFDDILSERSKLQVVIANLEVENNFMKVNIGLQEQYIAKVQMELDQLRRQIKLNQIRPIQNHQSSQEKNRYLKSYQSSQFGIQTHQISSLAQNFSQSVKKQIRETQNTQVQTVYREEFNIKPHVQTIQKVSADQATQSQLNFREQSQLQYLRELAVKFENQTKDFNELIEHLEQEKLTLVHQNKTLSSLIISIKQQVSEKILLIETLSKQIKKYEQKSLDREISDKIRLDNMVAQNLEKEQKINKLEQMISRNDSKLNPLTKDYETCLDKISMLEQSRRQMIIENTREIQKLTEIIQRTEQQKYQIHKIYDQTVTKLRNLEKRQNSQITNEKNNLNIHCQSLKLQLAQKQQLLRQNENLLLSLQAQNQDLKYRLQLKEQNITSEFRNYKDQLQSLLEVLQRKDQILTQKQDQIGRQMENKQIICFKNQQALRKQTELQAIVIHYQERIKKIQSSLEAYIRELMENRKSDNQMEINNLIVINERERKSFEIDKQFLVQKIQNLQKELSILNTQNRHYEINSKTYSYKCEQNESIIDKLRTERLNISKQYQAQLNLNVLLRQENVKLLEKISNQQTVKEKIVLEIEKLKNNYNHQLNDMQCQLYRLQQQLQKELQKNSKSKILFQTRLTDVKKDYDILYAKYIKYKNLSMVLQENKHLKF